MSKIVYYVASSLDGYIAGPENDISKFVPGGNGVEKYLSDLQDFKTVIMGRNTYEFGYKFGLKPGQPAYPHMMHHVFSNHLILQNPSEQVRVEKISMQRIEEIKATATTDIYLCGGGHFAGWLLDNQMIDILKLKLNPIILGGGVSLFGDSNSSISGKLLNYESFEEGLQILTYDLKA